MIPYEERRQPTLRFCPQCQLRKPPRESIVMQYYWGEENGIKKWILSCADFSICDYRQESTRDVTKEDQWSSP